MGLFGPSLQQRYDAALAEQRSLLAAIRDQEVECGGINLAVTVIRREARKLVPNHPLAVEESFWREVVAEAGFESYLASARAGNPEPVRREAARQRGRLEGFRLIRGEWSLPDLITPTPVASREVMARLRGETIPARAPQEARMAA